MSYQCKNSKCMCGTQKSAVNCAADGHGSYFVCAVCSCRTYVSGSGLQAYASSHIFDRRTQPNFS